MQAAPAGYLYVITAHARAVDADARERFQRAATQELARSDALGLRTCHRIEVYLADDPPSAVTLDALPPGGRVLRDGDAVRHAMALAAGLDSAVVSEDQVLHQLRRTVADARSTGRLHPLLEQLFSVALRVGRRSRTWRPVASRSLVDEALDRIAPGPLTGCEVLVVGAGEVGRLAATAAQHRGARVTVASRTPERAEELAGAVGAAVAPLDPRSDVSRFQLVVVCLAGAWSVAADTERILREAAPLVIDLSAPAALPTDTRRALRGRYIGIDDLARSPLPVEERLVKRLEAIVDEASREFHQWLSRRHTLTTVRALAQRAESERSSELAELWRRLPDLGSAEREQIESMSRHLTRRLLREPLVRLAHDDEGHRERAARDLFGL